MENMQTTYINNYIQVHDYPHTINSGYKHVQYSLLSFYITIMYY